MDIIHLVINASVIAWLLPIFRQLKSKLFYFFLILGLMDPLTRFISTYLNLMQPGVLYSVGSLLLFFSIENTIQDFLKSRIMNLLLVVGCLIGIMLIQKLEILVALLQVLILYKFIKILVIKLYNLGELNLFYLVLIFYELSVIINLIVIASGTETDIKVFIATLSFQILVAIFFTIFREDSEKLTIQAKIAD